MQDKTKLEDFKKYLNTIKEFKADDLIRREELGAELNFSKAYDDFERCINLFKKLDAIDTFSLPNEKINELNTAMNEFIGFINQVKSYSSTQGSNQRDHLINQITNSYNTWFQKISPVVAFCMKAGTDFEVLQRKANESSQEIQRLFEVTKANSESKEKELEEILNAVRKAAANVGVTNHTVNFSNAADDYKTNKIIWLKVIVAIMFVIIGFSVWAFMYMHIDKELPYQYIIITAVMPRITILLTLFYALHIASVNYRANSHNLIVNKNKQNALSTFETFVKATDDEDVKNSVLLTTTKSIFANSQTGFLKNEGSASDDMQIVEVVKDITKMSKP